MGDLASILYPEQFLCVFEKEVDTIFEKIVILPPVNYKLELCRL